MHANKIFLFILVYNCQNELEKTIKKIQNFYSFFDEIIFINNNSTDNSLKILKKYIRQKTTKKIKIINNKSNFGQGGSHKVAFEYSFKNNANFCTIYHGDDQANTLDFKSLLINKKYLKFDAVLGGRFMRESTHQNYALYRVLGNKFFNFLFQIITKKEVCDLGSGFNIYGAKVFKNDYVYFIDNNMGFNYQNFLLMTYNRIKYKFIPMSWKSEGEKSNVRLINQTLMVLGIAFNFMLYKFDYFKKIKKNYLKHNKVIARSQIYEGIKIKNTHWKFRL